MAEETKLSKRHAIKRLYDLRDKMSLLADCLAGVFGQDYVIDEVMTLRRYTMDAMRNTLKGEGIFKLDGVTDLITFGGQVGLSTEDYMNMGLLTESGDYLLAGRYTLPIRGIDNRVVAFVGWFPDKKKYVTSPSFGFSRDTSFYNFCSYTDALRKDGVTFLVEGIFDTLALKSLGLPALGNMGLGMSAYKKQMLTRYTKVIALNDNDEAGKTVLPFEFNKYSKSVWKLPNGLFIRLSDSLKDAQGKRIKDADDLVREYDCYDDLITCKSKSGIYILK